MSKKKGSTMTLKDFHGGSIPSDLPLPSAPGASARPPDRPSPWAPPALGAGSGSARPDPFHHRNSRHGSAAGPLPRGPDPPFLPGSIGRHFDEDERKPFDPSAPPRRPMSDPSPRPARSDPPPPPRPQPQSQQRPVGPGGPNAWGARKEQVLDPAPPAAMTMDRLARASAVEKISSGWRHTSPVVAAVPMATRVPAAGTAETEAIRVQEVDRRFGESVRVEEETRGSYDGGGPRLPPPQQQVAGPLDAAGARPKLKLLPRSRLMDASEALASEEKQFYRPSVDTLHVENIHEMHGSINVPRPMSAGSDSGSKVVDRPRLNLKPRSLPVEHLDENIEGKRKTVFGNARPRELVLKERGVDSIVASTPEVTSPANRFKNDISKTELKSEPSAPISRRAGERLESFPSEQRNGKDLEGKEHRSDLEKVEGTSWRNDNRRNTRATEKPVERRQETDTWRKPVVEQPNPDVAVRGPRHGKAASALELAQAFSRSMSDTNSNHHVPSQRSLPTSRAQEPFSRLTDTRELYSGPSQRQINGY